MSHEEKGYGPDQGAEKSDMCLGAGRTVSEWTVSFWQPRSGRVQPG